MAAFNGSVSSIGPTGYMREALGVRLFAPVFIGPEMAQLWCGDYQQLEFGAHITGLPINTQQWSMGTGFAVTSDQRYGPYLRAGFNTRF